MCYDQLKVILLCHSNAIQLEFSLVKSSNEIYFSHYLSLSLCIVIVS